MEKRSKSAREAAMLILYDIEKNGAYSGLAMNQFYKTYRVSDADRGFVTELVYGVVRRKLYLDYFIQQFSKLRLKKISPYLRQLLRICAYQLKELKHIPPSAVCNEAVKLAKRYGHHASAGFVNAVVRAMSAEIDTVSLPNRDQNWAEYTSIAYSCPIWLVHKLEADYGMEFTEAFLQDALHPHPVTIRVNTLKTNRDALQASLQELNIASVPGVLSPDSLRLIKAGNIEILPQFQDGAFTVQDESSQLVAQILEPKPGEQVLDLCSAPGGKATHIAQLMQDSGAIMACDIHPHKIKLIEHGANRLGIHCINARLSDAQIPVAEFENLFDCVLCDVPCSGLGLIAKKPDLKYNKQEDDFTSLLSVQHTILKNAAAYVKRGGTLVYSTCTINPQENQAQVLQFLKEHPGFSLVPIHLPTLQEPAGMLSLYPQTHQTDGFFIAKLIKNG